MVVRVLVLALLLVAVENSNSNEGDEKMTSNRDDIYEHLVDFAAPP